MIQFDVILTDLGGMGLSQVILFVMLSYFNITGGFTALATVFIAYEPDARCNVPPLDNTTAYPNLTESDILNLTTPYDPWDGSYDECSRYGYDLDLCQGDLSCVNKSYPIISCDKGYHYDKSLFDETVITEFNMICSNSYLNALSTSLYYVGMLIGSLAFGNFADLFGRKMCCIVTFTLSLACMFGITFNTSVILYMILRVFLAAFQYGSTIGTYVYIMEIVGVKWRTFAGLAYQIFFSIGFMVMGGIAYNWRDWHDIMLVSSLLSIPFLIFSILVPESPRWLFAKNKDEQGFAVTRKMAAINRVTIRDETWLKAKEAGEESKENIKNDRKYSSIDLFRSKGIAIITVQVMFNWFVNSFVYYGISLNAGSLAGDLFVNNTLNGVFEIASYTFCILLMDRIGRKKLLSFLLFLAGIGLLCSVIVSTYAGNNQSLITLGLVFAFTAKFGIAGSFSVIYNVTSELYPTVVRSNGIGVGSFAARIGGIIAPYVIYLQEYAQWLPNTIFGVLAIAAGLASLFFPETMGNHMMDTIEEAESFYRRGKAHSEETLNDLTKEKEKSYTNAAFEYELSTPM